MPTWDASYRLGTYTTEAEADQATRDGLRRASRAHLTSLTFGTAASPGRGWIADVNGTVTDVEAFKKLWS